MSAGPVLARATLAAVLLFAGTARGQTPGGTVPPATAPPGLAPPETAPGPGSVTPPPGHVPAAVVTAAHNEFERAYDAARMNGVAASIKSCYAGAGTARGRIIQCLLEDISAKRLDNAMRQVALRQNNSDPGPIDPYLGDDVFNQRVTQYAEPIFGTPQAMVDYFGNAAQLVVERDRR